MLTECPSRPRRAVAGVLMKLVPRFATVQSAPAFCDVRHALRQRFKALRFLVAIYICLFILDLDLLTARPSPPLSACTMSYSLALSESPRLTHDHKAYQPALSISANSKENIELSPIDLGSARLGSRTNSDTSHHKSSAIHLAKARQAKQSTPRGKARLIIRNIWLTALLPVVAFAYLSFCYVFAMQVIPVRVYKVDQPLDHLCKCRRPEEGTCFKITPSRWNQGRSDDYQYYHYCHGASTRQISEGECTNPSFLYWSSAVLMSSQGEEFFRRLRSSQTEFVNNISTPSHSVFRGVIVVVRAQASGVCVSLNRVWFG